MISKERNNKRSVLVPRYQSIGFPIEVFAGCGCAIEGTAKSLDSSKVVRRNINNVRLFQNRKLKCPRKVEVSIRTAASDQGTN